MAWSVCQRFTDNGTNMEYIQHNHIRDLAVAHKGQHAVYIGNHLDFETYKERKLWDYVIEEVKMQYPDPKKFNDIMSGLVHGGLFFFENEEQAQQFYAIFNQPSTQHSGLYACLYDNTGVSLTGNT